MSTGGNKAQIDLTANPETLKPGMDKARDSVEEFSKAVMDSMKDSNVTVEHLEKSFKELVDELSNVIDKNAESTKSTLENIEANRRSRDMLLGLLKVVRENILTIGILTATAIKCGGSMADKAAKVKLLIGALATLTLTATNCTIGLGKLAGVMLPVGIAASKAGSNIAYKATQVGVLALRLATANPLMVAATAATLGLGKAFAATGQKVEQEYGKPVEWVSNLLNTHQHQVKEITATLKEMGLELEDVGLKATSNWDILKKKAGEAAESTFHLKAIYNGISNAGTEAYRELSKATTAFFTAAQENISSGLDGWNHYAKKANDYVGDMYLRLMGHDKAYIENVRKLAKEAEEVQKKSKADEIRKKQIADDIALSNKWTEAWRAARIADEQSAKANALVTVEAVEKEIAVHEELRKKLEKEGKLTSEAGKQWKEYYDKLIAKQVELSKVTDEFGKVWFKTMSPERAKELGLLAEYTQLNVEATRQWKQAIADYDKQAIETNRNVMQAEKERGAPREYLRDLLEEEEETLDKLIASEEGGTEKLIKQMNRVDDLKQRIRDKEREESEAELNRKLRGYELEIEKEKQLKGIKESLEDTQRHTEQDEILRNLEKQGASLKALHEQKMKFIDEEEQIASVRAAAEHPGDEVAQARIKADAEKQRIREIADFKRQSEADLEKQEELRLEHGNEVALKNLQGVKDADVKLHKERMRQIDEEEDRLLKKANSEAEKLNIKLNMEKARDKERADFNSKPSQQFVKPKTRKELLADAKKARQAAEAQARANKAAQVAALFEKKQALAKKTIDNRKAVLAKAQDAKNKQLGIVNKDKDKGVPFLERIANAAEKTNQNEQKLIATVDNAGALK